MSRALPTRPLVAFAALLAAALAPAPPASAASLSSAGISVSPQPGTPDASPGTQISLLGIDPAAIESVAARGSRSGPHAGLLRPYSAAPGASFVPDARFAAGETVTVTIRWRSGVTSYRFRIARPVGGGVAGAPFPQRSAHTLHFVSRPDLHPTRLRVHGRADGDIFLAPIYSTHGGVRSMDGQYGPTIYDSAGNLVWSLPVGPSAIAMDFAEQRYGGAPVLTWWQGQVGSEGVGDGEAEIVDSSYRQLARVRAGNGYRMDLHEFRITPEGSAWLIAYAPVHADLSSLRGPRDGRLYDTLVQEVDIATGLVMYEWHALGHIPLRDSYAPLPRRASAAAYDPFHFNTIDASHPGAVLVSARNTWTAYAIDLRTARIDWRLGGRHSSFRLAPTARFAWQHDVRFAPGGRVSLFDNESYGTRAGRASRGLVLRLDARHHAARIAGEYRHARPPLFAASMGSEELLPNGDTLAGWGSTPYLSEFSRGGRLLFDARFDAPVESYRAYLFDWHGHPTAPPDVAARQTASGVTVYTSWNGATDVARWRLLAGASATSMAAVAEAARHVFETAIAAPPGAGPLFEVQALDAHGALLGSSAPVAAR